MTPVDIRLIQDVLLAALREDVGSGDVTARAVVSAEAVGIGRIAAKEALTLSGIRVAEEIARLVDSNLQFKIVAADALLVGPGDVIAVIEGPARSLLTAERTMLNVLQRMSGIATETRRYVDRVAGTKARIIDTRKTAPGLRVLDKYAVTCGGGFNHRAGLFDGVLIKNNHIAFHESPANAIRAVRQHIGHLTKIEVEVHKLEELVDAIGAGADVVLLDNFTPEQTRQAVELASGRVPLESSGGITIDNVREYAEAGVDYISVGALTHSVPAVDIHMRVISD